MQLIDQLEKEAIDIIRDVSFAHDFGEQVLLYSLGKDSSVLLHLFEKAFHPQSVPMDLLHVDTGFKFPEMYDFRDKIGAKHTIKIYKNPACLNPWDHEKQYTDVMKTEALKTALREANYKIAFCGARRDEEKSRAKEHIISIRDENGRWDPKQQNPEFPNVLNPFVQSSCTARVFPLSNWTELDIWNYIKKEDIEILPLYFTHKRRVINKDGLLISSFSEEGEEKFVRFRTLGCWPLTGAVEEEAGDLNDVIVSVASARNSERVTRAIDYDQENSMERRKQNGYF